MKELLMAVTVALDGNKRLLWQFSPDGLELVSGFKVCENPFCMCREMTVSFIKDGRQGPLIPDLSLDLDLDNIVKNTGGGERGPSINSRINGELDADGLNLLKNVFRVTKALQDGNYNPETGPFPEFDVEEIELGSQCTLYRDIFPWNPWLQISIENKTYAIDDSYCFRPWCPCTSGFLFLTPIVDGKKVKKPQYPSFMYDYRSCSWSKPHGWKGYPFTPETAVARMAEQIPDIAYILKKRHERLKTMYERYREINGVDRRFPLENTTLPGATPASVINTPAPGRNDPCPCGSGKKYKKCCG